MTNYPTFFYDLLLFSFLEDNTQGFSLSVYLIYSIVNCNQKGSNKLIRSESSYDLGVIFLLLILGSELVPFYPE